MTISSSLNASVAGLAANARRLATISDNIANSATNGYRRVETDFHSMVIANKGGTYSAGGVRTLNLAKALRIPRTDSNSAHHSTVMPKINS